MKSFLVNIFCIFFVQAIMAQNGPWSTRLFLAVPKAVSNDFYSKTYRGVVSVGLSLDYTLKSNIIFGLQSNYSLFEPKNVFIPYVVSTNETFNSSFFSWGLHIGYRFVNDEDMIADVQLAYQLSNVRHKSLLDSFTSFKQNNANSPSVNIGAYWYVEEYKLLLVGGNLQYNFVNTLFNAKNLGYINSTSNNNKLSYLTIGFSVIYKFGLPKD